MFFIWMICTNESLWDSYPYAAIFTLRGLMLHQINWINLDSKATNFFVESGGKVFFENWEFTRYIYH